MLPEESNLGSALLGKPCEIYTLDRAAPGSLLSLPAGRAAQLAPLALCLLLSALAARERMRNRPGIHYWAQSES